MKALRIFLIFFLYASLVMNAQTVVKMEKAGGVYRVPCTINGMKLKFIFDTGASCVCLSESTADLLYDNGYINDDDIIGYDEVSIADGSTHETIKFKIRDFEIGNLHLHNVDAVAVKGQKAPLLMGQSVIEKLGPILIDGDRLIINKGKTKITDAEIKKLNKQEYDAFQNEDYQLCLRTLKQIDEAVGLSSYGLWHMMACYSSLNDYETALTIAQRWEERYDVSDEWAKLIYRCIFDCYEELKDYDNQCKYGEKILLKSNVEDLTLYDAVRLGYLAGAYCFIEPPSYNKAIVCIEKSITIISSNYNITTNSISRLNGNAEKEGYDELGRAYYVYGLILEWSNHIEDSSKKMIYAAKLGNKSAIQYCEEKKLNYRKVY